MNPVVAVVYHFFPHYRKGIMEALAHTERCQFTLFADTVDPFGGVKPMDTSDLAATGKYFRVTSRLRRKKNFTISGVAGLALRRRYSVLIFLGDPNSPSIWLGAILGRLTGKRVLFWAHGWTKQTSGLKARLADTFFSLPNGLLLYGHHARGRAIEKGFSPDNLYVVYNSLPNAGDTEISDDARAMTRSEFFAHPDRPMLICTTRLTPQRELPLAFEAMKILAERGNPMNLLLVGDGPEQDRLAALAAKSNLAVHFYGACYDEDVLSRLIQSADMTVSPGQVGLTAMHSLANGVPVATHNDPYSQMPEWEAIVDGWSGVLFGRGSATDLADRLIGWFQDTPNRAVVRRRCRAVIERFYNAEHQVGIICGAVEGRPAHEDGWSEFLKNAKAEALS